MKALGVNEVREAFLSFFEKKKHVRLPSFSVVPQNDNSLLLINSGMAPLKPYFTGQEIPPGKRVATCQKCIRTGDIENVGKTARHGTFFEMLGNFSFGDYFKKESIAWAWEFVTQVLEIPKDKLYISIYLDDEETHDIWHKEIGIPEDRIVRLGKADNFWEHGIGPCGPCSEIYYDRGPEYGCDNPDCAVGCDCDRYMEFWNLVFTQYEKKEDGSYVDLAHPNIDTGMGLERMATIMQGVDSIFDVDTLRRLRDCVAELAKVEYGKDARIDVSLRVITDHIRSVTMMVADGVLPSNEGRGYVLRRLLRRAARHGKLLGIEKAFLAELSEVVIAISGDAYPQLLEKKDSILKILSVEEKSFYKTIDKGMELLRTDMQMLKDSSETVMSGEKAFRLYDTYGFPIDLTREILEEEGLMLDEDAFSAQMQAQKTRARAARGESTYMGAAETVYHQLDAELSTEFVGYDTVTLADARVIALIADQTMVDSASAGAEVAVFLDRTPFYAESGGQTGDQGKIFTETGVVQVTDCIKVVGGKIAHVGTLTEGSLSVGDTVTASVDETVRLSVARNHSATHLLQKALRSVLGTHVEQAGSYVGAERLRFDFTHFSAMTEDELRRVAEEVNAQILAGLPIDTCQMSMEDAREKGAIALFGEKYGDQVRVVQMGNYSIELCGGTHLTNTAQIASFQILSENGVAAGVRRIEAVTGLGALRHYEEQEILLRSACRTLKTTPDLLLSRLEQILLEQKEQAKELESVKARLAKGAAEEIMGQVEKINGVSALFTQVSSMEAAGLKTLGDQIKEKLGSGVLLLASEAGGKVQLLAMATDDVVKSGVHAGNIIKAAAAACGGGGGGRPNMAQAGGKDSTKISDALAKGKEVLTTQLLG